MNDKKSSSANGAEGEATWPRKLNKALIGIGVIAFGLIITDRMIAMFEADDLPDVAQTEQPQVVLPDEQVVQLAEPVASQTVPTVDEPVVDVVDVVEPVLTEPAELVAAAEEILNIDNVFGSPLVFVSASEPLYVITENERRIDVGAQIDDQTVLAGVTNEWVVLQREGQLRTINLPEPDAR